MSYPKIRDFGGCLRTNDNNAVAESLLYNQDFKFGFGPGNVDSFGPAGINSQAYMAQRCANTWDKYCEIYYLENDAGNERYYPNTFKSNDGQCSTNLGTSLLKNAGELRFLNFDKGGCDGEQDNVWYEPLNPLIADSPMVKKYTYRRALCNSTLTDHVDNRTIDSDPLMQRMLANPNPNKNTLKQIYILTQMNRNNVLQRNGLGDERKVLDGTQTGAILDNFFSGQQRLANGNPSVFTNYGIASMK